MNTSSILLVLVAVVAFTLVSSCQFVSAGTAGRSLVIIDTDIGNDFDDSASITTILASQGITQQGGTNYIVKLILSATYGTTGRAKLIAQYLLAYNLQDKIDIGVGVQTHNSTFVGPLENWRNAQKMTWEEYEKKGGTVHQDGVKAAADLILKYADQKEYDEIIFLCIAPDSNFKALVSRFPNLPYHKVRAVAMMGAIHYCYGHSPSSNCQEYNVKDDPAGAQAWLHAGFSSRVATPLDTCGRPYSVIGGNVWKQFLQKNTTSHPFVQVIIESFCFWSAHGGYQRDCLTQTSPWFDAVAAFLLLTRGQWMNLQSLPIQVTGDGRTVISPDHGTPISEALTWKSGGVQEWQNTVLGVMANPRP